MLTNQTFKINNYKVELERHENIGTITITRIEGDEKSIIEAEFPTLRKIIKCLTDSPYIFSDNNK